MSKKIPQILITAGAVLIVAACALMIYNKVDDNLAGRRAQQLLDQMLEQMFEEDEYVSTGSPQQPESSQTSPGQIILPPGGQDSEAAHTGGEEAEEESGEAADENTAVKKSQPLNYSTLGVLQIPAVSIRLPIIDGWTDARGNVAPCSIAGTADPKPRKLIIAGHNLKSHFKSLIDLNVGDEVLFTAKDGTTYRYSVVEVGQCHRDNPEEVSSGSGWDMTLVTCKTIRTMRTLIRCAEIPDKLPGEPAAG